MSLFGAVARVVGGAASKVIRPIVANSAVKSVVKQTAIGAGAYALGNSIFGSPKSTGMPPMPTGALPALPGAGAPAIVGDRGWFQNDPNIVAALQPFAISKTNLKQCYRSPIKGYVIRYDSAGDPYAIPKSMARAYLGWKPAKKPPLSVGDWQAIQRADRATKKVRRIMTTITRVDKAVSGGKVRIGRKKGSK